MPVITLSTRRISSLLGAEVTVDSLAELLSRLGMGIEEVGEGYVKVEYNPNRPDFCSSVGIARALAGILGIKTGMPRYRVRKSRYKLYVDPNVKEVRPYITGLVADGLKLSDDDVAELIEMQEDLHWVLGRDRRKVAIGFHDADKIRFPLTYKAVGFDSVRFVPLKGEVAMTPREIMLTTEQGMKYSHILQGKKGAPLIIDAKGEVLSFPPIINSKMTEVTTMTKRLFVDVTGTDQFLVNKTINIIAAHLAELGASLSSIIIVYGRKSFVTPDMSPEKWKVRLHEITSLIGVELKSSEVVRALKRMRMDARAVGGNFIEVIVPPYRTDVIHPVDFAEEVGIGIGYDSIEPEVPRSFTVGSLTLETRIKRKIRELMIGLGFTEALNTTLSNRRSEFSNLLLEDDGLVKILNPVSREYDTLRRRLLPSLLNTLKNNKHYSYPQKFFEVGDVVRPDPSVPEKVARATYLALVSSHTNASYSEVKSIGEELLRFLNLDAKFVERDYPFFISGRSVAISRDGEEVGYLGEVHPQVLNNFELYMPVAALELDVGAVLKGSEG